MTIKKGAIICMAMITLASTPVYASTDTSTVPIQQTEESKTIQPRSNTLTYSSRTIANNKISLFNNSGSVFVLYNGSRATFVCNFNKAAKVEMGFYNSSTGVYTKLYTGTVRKQTVTYSPKSTVRGYFYVKNLSGSSLTVSSATVTI